MDFITRKPPDTSVASGAELQRYLAELTEDFNRALEQVKSILGERDGWSWRRYPDGIAECWRSERCFDVSCTQPLGSLYESGVYGGIAYPFEFSDKPLQLISITETDDAPYLIEQPHGRYSATARYTGRWRFLSPASCEGGYAVVSIYARGRVKR